MNALSPFSSSCLTPATAALNHRRSSKSTRAAIRSKSSLAMMAFMAFMAFVVHA
jgi:hypothetical protein